MGSTRPAGTRPTGTQHAAAVSYMESYIAEHGGESTNDMLMALETCKDYYSVGGNIDIAESTFNALDEWHTTTSSASNYAESIAEIDVIYLGIFGEE